MISKDLLSQVSLAIRNDKLIIFPTDTVLAIACNPFSKVAIKQLFDVKKRDYRNPLPIMARSFDDVKNFLLLLSKLEKRLIENKNNEKVTIVLRSNSDELLVTPPDSSTASPTPSLASSESSPFLPSTSASNSGNPSNFSSSPSPASPPTPSLFPSLSPAHSSSNHNDSSPPACSGDYVSRETCAEEAVRTEGKTGERTIALRIPAKGNPDNNIARQILSVTGPLAATSANFSGLPPFSSTDEAERFFGDSVAVYINGKVVSSPSKIVQVINEKIITLRE